MIIYLIVVPKPTYRMGYYIFSYGINTEKIKATFGSKDQTILNEVKASEMFESYNDELIKGEKLSHQTALEHIINGDAYLQKYGYKYGYAFISICATLGIKLPHSQEIKLVYETDLINKYMAKDFELKGFEIDEELLSNKDYISFDIPTIEDWPMISVISNASLKELKNQLRHIAITDEMIDALEDSDEDDLDDDEDDEDKICAYEHIRGIIQNIDYCIDNQLDMVSFCH
jgi:hypothetical protein